MKEVWINATEIDREVAEETPCEDCGGKCVYESKFYTGDDGQEHYRAFAVCLECGKRWEF